MTPTHTLSREHIDCHGKAWPQGTPVRAVGHLRGLRIVRAVSAEGVPTSLAVGADMLEGGIRAPLLVIYNGEVVPVGYPHYERAVALFGEVFGQGLHAYCAEREIDAISIYENPASRDTAYSSTERAHALYKRYTGGNHWRRLWLETEGGRGSKIALIAYSHVRVCNYSGCSCRVAPAPSPHRGDGPRLADPEEARKGEPVPPPPAVRLPPGTPRWVLEAQARDDEEGAWEEIASFEAPLPEVYLILSCLTVGAALWAACYFL